MIFLFVGQNDSHTNEMEVTMKRLFFILLFVFVASCSKGNVTTINIEMINANSESIGQIKLSEMTDGVELDIQLEGLPPGGHGIHFHEKGICEAPDFVTAGSHLNPNGNEHGLMNPEGAHLGDLTNIEADDQGKVSVQLKSNMTLNDEKNTLLPMTGTAIVIHKNPDDGISQPAGGAGERIACGIVSQGE